MQTNKKPLLEQGPVHLKEEFVERDPSYHSNYKGETVLLPDPESYYRNEFPEHDLNDEWTIVNCCFHADRSPSLAINLEHGGFKCNACDESGGGIVPFHIARYGLSYSETMKELKSFCEREDGLTILPSKATTSEGSEKKGKRVRKILKDSIPDNGLVAKYLNKRGLSGKIPNSLLLHSGLEYWVKKGSVYECLGKFPAMIGVFALNDCRQGIHVTYLEKYARSKADVPSPKKTMGMGEPFEGSSIHLFEPEPSMPLIVCEGIETGLAMNEHSGWPVWVAGNKDLLKTIEIPSGIESVYIGADKDRSNGGQEVGEKLASRLHSLGHKVHLCIPPGEIPEGQNSLDWLDILTADKGVAHV